MQFLNPKFPLKSQLKHKLSNRDCFYLAEFIIKHRQPWQPKTLKFTLPGHTAIGFALNVVGRKRPFESVPGSLMDEQRLRLILESQQPISNHLEATSLFVDQVDQLDLNDPFWQLSAVFELNVKRLIDTNDYQTFSQVRRQLLMLLARNPHPILLKQFRIMDTKHMTLLKTSGLRRDDIMLQYESVLKDRLSGSQLVTEHELVKALLDLHLEYASLDRFIQDLTLLVQRGFKPELEQLEGIAARIRQEGTLEQLQKVLELASVHHFLTQSMYQYFYEMQLDLKYISWPNLRTWMKQQEQSCGHSPDSCKALILLLLKAGKTETAMQLLQDLLETQSLPIDYWNQCLEHMHHTPHFALKDFQHTLKRHVSPNRDTFYHLLQLCVSARDPLEAVNLRETMPFEDEELLTVLNQALAFGDSHCREALE
ncbi:hypothetical protein EDD86DRAFT_211374 [Gorgonomyces haynaldii]|nr:hypothetical protein EDD86DRAFT_211374 [Gorgonomyces haynaldii]